MRGGGAWGTLWASPYPQRMGAGTWVGAARPLHVSPFALGRASPCSRCGFGRCRVLPCLNPKLHLFAPGTRGRRGPGARCRNLGAPRPATAVPGGRNGVCERGSHGEHGARNGLAVPGASQAGREREPDTVCSSWPQRPAFAPYTTNPSPVPVQGMLGGSARFPPHPTPCTLVGERVGLLHTCV